MVQLRPIRFFGGLTLANHILLTSGFRPIKFFGGLTSANHILSASRFRPIRFFGDLSSANHILSASGFRPVRILESLTWANQVLWGLTWANQILLASRVSINQNLSGLPPANQDFWCRTSTNLSLLCQCFSWSRLLLWDSQRIKFLSATVAANQRFAASVRPEMRLFRAEKSYLIRDLVVFYVNKAAPLYCTEVNVCFVIYLDAL